MTDKVARKLRTVFAVTAVVVTLAALAGFVAVYVVARDAADRADVATSFSMQELARAPNETLADSPIVERGRYLALAANCVSCHTVDEGELFAGGKAFATTFGFLGKIYSSNITPDRETGIGSWTERDFIKAMRFGLAPGNKHLFPAFPYTAFTKLTTPDIKAIHAYLRTVPPVRAAVPRGSIWFRQRWVITLWNRLYLEPGALVPNAAQSDAWNRGYYLVEALGHCRACHTPRSLLLAERAESYLTGGVQIDIVGIGKQVRWSAPNLTSAESGLGPWSQVDLQKYLKTGHSRRAGTFGPMNEVIANSSRHLADADIAAMAVYLKSLPANGESPRHSLSEDSREAGQVLYDKYCEECHLSSGRGGLRKAPPVAGSAIVQAQDAASLINVILHGAEPAADISTSFDAWEGMPGFADEMTDAEVAQLTNFLRTHWGNRGGPVSAAAVREQR